MADIAVVPQSEMTPQTLESVLLGGDLEKLTPAQRVSYYTRVCESLGLNPLTKPFAFLKFNGRTLMYALKDCTEQLRTLRGISLKIISREVTEGVYVVTAQATGKDGRQDESLGAVPLEGLKGEARANAVMKAETKAKRRVTLSICGLGMLDESEVDSIPRESPEEARTLKEALDRTDTTVTQLKASIAANDEKAKAKKLAKQVEAAAEILEGEIVEEKKSAFLMPWDSKRGEFKMGDPIEGLETATLRGMSTHAKISVEVRAACLAELARRSEGEP